MKPLYRIEGPFTRRQKITLARLALILIGLAVAGMVLVGLNLTMQADRIEARVELPETVEPELAEPESLGEFIITHYAIDERCCDKTDGITSTGTKAEVGRTIAVDPEVIPYGTEVIIDGTTYVAEDCGGAVNGKHIDILVSTYDEAVSRGKITREVFLKGE